jgi:hypothetical protein
VDVVVVAVLVAVEGTVNLVNMVVVVVIVAVDG